MIARGLAGVAVLLLVWSCGSDGTDSSDTPGRFLVTFGNRLVSPFPVALTELSVNVFDSETLQWQYPGGSGAASLPAGVESPTSLGVLSATVGDGVLMFGGNAALQVLHYDRPRNRWTFRQPMPEPRFNMTATRLADGSVLLAGGAAGTGGLLQPSLRSAAIYNPVTDEYVSVGAMNQPRHLHYSAPLPDGRVLLVGGIFTEPGSLQFLDSAEIYDPVTRNFTVTGSMSAWRIDAVLATLLDGRILIAGDNPPESWPAIGYAEIYDPSAGVFLPTAPMLEDRHGPVAVTLRDGRVLVAGGKSNTPGSSSTAEIYDPVADQFTPAADMTVGRWGAAAALLPDGRVLVIGGTTPDAALPGCELYDPQSDSWTALTDLADDDCRWVTPPISLPLPLP